MPINHIDIYSSNIQFAISSAERIHCKSRHESIQAFAVIMTNNPSGLQRPMFFTRHHDLCKIYTRMIKRLPHLNGLVY